ncbi:group I intron-associated PD-(D/E)XK endonuclease [Paenibacillus taichungensis]
MDEQKLADAREVVIAGKLMLEGYTISKPLTGSSRYDLIAEKDGKMAKIQVKSLKLDSAYEDNDDRVYKLEAYSLNPTTKKKNLYNDKEVDIIVGYNHTNGYFAAVPLASFAGRYSCVIHTVKGKTRNEFMNSWKALYEFMNEDKELSEYKKGLLEGKLDAAESELHILNEIKKRSQGIIHETDPLIVRIKDTELFLKKYGREY